MPKQTPNSAPATQQSDEAHTRAERRPVPKSRARQVGSRVAMAATCVLPAADLMTSDTIFAKVYTHAEALGQTGSPLFNSIVGGVAMGTVITAQSVALAEVVSRNKKLANVFEGYDEYREARQASMSKPRRALSWVGARPFYVFEKIGDGFNAVGNKLDARRSPAVRAAGRLALDAGKTNTYGTLGVALEETAAGTPPSLARNVRLGGVFAATWVGLAEPIKHLYRADLPVVTPTMGAIGRGFTELTTMNMAHPAVTPVGSTFLIGAATALAVGGWNMARYSEQREADVHADPNTDIQTTEPLVIETNPIAPNKLVLE